MALTAGGETAELYEWFGHHCIAAGMWHLLVFRPGRFDIAPVCFADGAKGVEHFTDIFDEAKLNAGGGIYNLRWDESAEDPIRGSF